MDRPEQHVDPEHATDGMQGREARSPTLTVPEYPALAPGVELLGEMRETGFKESQWLVRRGERYLQLTELLFRVAEQADGASTHEEMADGVTRSTDWLVGAEDIRQLLLNRLLPLGIVEAPEGGEFVIRERSTSLLRVNGRTKLLGPEVLAPVTGLLQILFAPVILVPVLLAIILAQVWMYAVHGLGDAVQAVLYAPGLILALLGVLLVSSIFHEFGHASALRYGGGETRGIGFGLYLVFPAFYTDTTESYRLGRWGRVRTDLGGFYFHLIFALGLIALYLLTGWEFLLVAVLMIDLGIVYQCLPFVRFDGYWALADITGIPDFFSQMGAFLRSISPVSRWREGVKLPDLKPWVKAVFIAYVAVTVPVLSLLVFVLVTRLPGIATTLWYSMGGLAAVFSRALGEGDLIVMVLAVVQMLILGLQTLGITYLLYSLVRRLLGAVWRRIAFAQQPGGGDA